MMKFTASITAGKPVVHLEGELAPRHYDNGKMCPCPPTWGVRTDTWPTAQAILRAMGYEDAGYTLRLALYLVGLPADEGFELTSEQIDELFCRPLEPARTPIGDPGAEVAPELFEDEALRREDEYRAMYDPSYDD